MPKGDLRNLMEFVFHTRPSDAPFVERVWRTQSQCAGSFLSLAASQWEIVLMKHHGKASFIIRGPSTKARSASFPEDAEYFGVVFRLGVFMPQLPTVNRLDGNDVILPKATGNAIWLNSSTWQYPDYENADVFVKRLVREGLLVSDPVVDAALQDRTQTLSVRSLQYRFLRATGLTYKLIQQIERAKHAKELLIQGTSILDTAYETGYSDQAHLTNSLKRFIGQTPSQLTGVSQAG